jgi:hypothetical protein
MRTAIATILALIIGLGVACGLCRAEVPLPPRAGKLEVKPLRVETPGATTVSPVESLTVQAPEAVVAPRIDALQADVPEAAVVSRIEPIRIPAMSCPESGLNADVLGAPEANLHGLLALEAVRAGDDAVLAESLDAEGIAAPTGTVRPLPAFFTGLHWLPTATFTYKHENCDLPAVPARVIRLVDGSAAWLLNRMKTEPDQKVVVLVTGNEVGLADGRALKLLAAPQVVAVVVGHIIATEGDPNEFATGATRVLEHLQLVRSVSNAPVLLSVSRTSSFGRNRRLAADWPKAFAGKLDRFDGIAVYNAGLFPLWESMTLAQMTEELGLPSEMPKLLLDFEGTRDGDDGRRAAELWKRRGRRFIQARRKEGWRGVLLVSTGTTGTAIDDYRRKAAMLKKLPGNLQFQKADRP